MPRAIAAAVTGGGRFTKGIRRTLMMWFVGRG